MRWLVTTRADPWARQLADRHYNRQNPGAQQFAPPGRCVVLRADTASGRAVWITSWPFAEYVKHEWAGAWVNTLFRNEGAGLSSELILEAIAATRWLAPRLPTWVFEDDAQTRRAVEGVPALGIVTFVDAKKVRAKRHPGYCYRRAGFELVGTTKEEGLLAFQLRPTAMPAPAPPLEGQIELFGGTS